MSSHSVTWAVPSLTTLPLMKRSTTELEKHHLSLDSCVITFLPIITCRQKPKLQYTMQYVFPSFSTVVRPGQHIGNTLRPLKLSTSDVSSKYSRSLGKIGSPCQNPCAYGVNVCCVHEAPPNTPLGWPCCSYGLQQTPCMVLYGELEEGSRRPG